MPRHLLVTGGAGFVGSAFVRHVVAATDDVVTVLDRLTYAGSASSLRGLPAERVELVVGDIRDEETVDRAAARADAIVHFAAESHNDRSLADPALFVDTNVRGTQVLLEAARRRGQRFHHVSTDEVYGDLGDDSEAVFTERSPFAPSSPYSASKAASDLLVKAWGRSFGVPVTVSNGCNTYGPFQHVEKFLPRQITNVLRGGRVRLYGDGRHVREWVHVDDHSRAVLAILDRGRLGESYLVGTGQQLANLELARRLLEAMGRAPGDIDFVADRPGHDLRYAADATKIRTDTGWTPSHARIEDGLAQTVAWYRENEWWWAPQKDDTEARYRESGH